MLVSFTLTSIMAAALLKPHEELAQERASWFYVRILAPCSAGWRRWSTATSG